jgi:hypothetical protein
VQLFTVVYAGLDHLPVSVGGAWVLHAPCWLCRLLVHRCVHRTVDLVVRPTAAVAVKDGMLAPAARSRQ